MSTSQSVSNGTKSNGKANGTNGHSQEVKIALPVPEPKATLSIDEKIQKVHDLNDLISKRQKLISSRAKLNSFNLKREESSTTITIQDNDGNSFVTGQTEAIDRIIDSLRNSIDSALSDVENKISF